jgi:hypothetical protein
MANVTNHAKSPLPTAENPPIKSNSISYSGAPVH